MPGSRRYAWRIVGFSQSRDTKADLKVEMMPRKKTRLSEVARTTTTEEGHKGSKEELKRASQEREEQGLSITGLTRKSKERQFPSQNTTGHYSSAKGKSCALLPHPPLLVL